MVTTVSSAFDQFRREYVDLNSAQVAEALRSQVDLQTQIQALAETESNFPRLDAAPPVFVPSGSFSRHTEIQPLDDIDFFVVMSPAGLTPEPVFWDWRKYHVMRRVSVWPRPRTSALAELAGENGKVSSTRVLNTFESTLAAIPNYEMASIKQTGKALSFKLTSYPWDFDIVPVIPVLHWIVNYTRHYLMPNGAGEWMRANPRKDAERAMQANQQQHGLLLPVIRLIKFWNKNQLQKGLRSCYVEALCFNVFGGSSRITTVQSALATFFERAPTWVRGGCPDPNGFGPPLDSEITRETKVDVVEAMQEAARKAQRALAYEQEDNIIDALGAWAAIFGPAFPHEEAKSGGAH